jgi:hypothetical protein
LYSILYPIIFLEFYKKDRYIQKEFKYAIDYSDSFPESEIYIIPARLYTCEISYEKLEEIQYVDLFPDWNKGVSQMLASVEIEIGDENKTTQFKKTEEWRMGLTDKDWRDLLN